MDGLGEWNDDIINQFDEFYIRLISEFGSNDEWPCN